MTISLKLNHLQSNPHILHVIQTLGSGGAERLLVTYLSEPVLKDHFQHTVVMTDVTDPHEDSDRTFLVNALEEQGVDVLGLGSPGPRHLIQAITKIKRLILDRDVKLIHSHLIWSNIAGRLAGKLAGIPVISSFHNSDYDPQVIASFRAPQWKQNLIRWADGWTARNCDTLSVAVSHYVAKHIEEYLDLDPNRIKVIHNPVDIEHLKPKQEEPRKYIREQLGINADSKVILSVGRVTDQKGFIELVQAFDAMENRTNDVFLVIVGGLVDQDYLERLNREIELRGLKDRIFLTGPQKDVGTWLAGADLFVFPTKFEGLGIALAEAMAAGLPCIATDVGPIPELIRDQETGILVALDTNNDLAVAMSNLMRESDFKTHLRTKAKEHIIVNFQSSDKSEQLAGLYKTIIAMNN